ncbi:DUF6498-containing protein [Halogeometricum luteum]|uniref:DUF6498-containing protein n=1 Tax=Halogeometricum luteum TaxID=2950537 RepID=A0ABU2G3G3_9EURY|nr:DUF6498-containing protein [Halogeometricum sp. S3BR5-2]MDS0295319.1 DUF6498-containing protein [Halogeometricum sp. S3BR5-2]
MLAVACVNLFPLVGVAVWEWNLTSLLVLYWVEAFVTVLIAVAKALLAERGSPDITNDIEPLHELRAKRGGWEPRPNWPSIYPRNIPLALTILGFWAVFLVPMTLLFWSSSLGSVLSVGLLAGILGLVVAQVGEFVTEYLRDERYTEVSAREILRTPTLLTFSLVGVGLLTVGSSGSDANLLLFVVAVLGKTLVSVYSFYAERVEQPLFGLGDRLLDEAEVRETPPEIDLPDAPVDARVRVARTPVILTSLPYIVFGFASQLGVIVLCLFVLALTSGRLSWIAITTLVILAIAGVRILSYYLRYGTIEYQRRGEMLVAYDTLLEAPQWKTDIERSSFSVKNAIADRLLETGTLTISGVENVEGSDVQFGPVVDLDQTVETLGLPVRETERPEQDLGVVAAVGLLFLFFLVLPVGLILDPDVSPEFAMALGAVFAPFILFHAAVLLWVALARV